MTRASSSVSTTSLAAASTGFLSRPAWQTSSAVLGVGGGIDAAAEEFVLGVDVFHLGESVGGDDVFQHDDVARLVDGEVGLGSDDHAEGLHLGDSFHMAAAVIEANFAEIDGAAL